MNKTRHSVPVWILMTLFIVCLTLTVIMTESESVGIMYVGWLLGLLSAFIFERLIDGFIQLFKN